jgi:hypothetical protein
MSRNTDPTHGCGGKRRYTTFERAQKDAMHTSRANEEPMHAYKCVPCNGFHVGHAKLALAKPAAPDDLSTEDDV